MEASRHTTQHRRAPLVDIFTVVAIDVVYLITFVLAARLKWSGGVPDWFATQFAGTWLAHLPGGISTSYYAIAVLETIAAAGFVVSVSLGEFLRRERPVFTAALVWSQFVFAVLIYGSRLTQKYDVAFTDFGYFLATIVILGWTQRAADGEAALTTNDEGRRSHPRSVAPSLAPLSLAALACLSCAAQSPPGASVPAVRWLKPSETATQGRAPDAKVRLLSTHPDGSKTYVLVLSQGDQVQAAIQAFAKAEQVVDARFSAIGAVRDPEVAWFDESRKQYKAMLLHEQMEVLTLSGDIALGVAGQPVVHTHLVLARSDGEAWGGHLIEATASPTIELYVTTYPEPLHKRLDPATNLQLLDP